MWAFYLYPRAIHWIIDGRFCAFWSADLQSILERTDLFQRAVGPGVSVLRVCGSLGWAWTGIFGTGRHGKQRSSQAFCTIWTTLFFLLLLLLSSPFFTLPLLTSSPRNTTCTTFHTVVRGGSVGPPRGKGGGGADQGQSGATRCPPSNTTNDAAIGQKRNIPTLLRRWLCPCHTVGPVALEVST